MGAEADKRARVLTKAMKSRKDGLQSLFLEVPQSLYFLGFHNASQGADFEIPLPV